MNVVIEKLTIDSLKEFWRVFSELINEGFPGYSVSVKQYFLTRAYSLLNFHYWITNNWKIIYVAKNDSQIIGFAVIDRPYGGVCFLRWLGVIKTYRSQGIGRQLIEAWLDYSQKFGCHKVEVAAQPEAERFYEKCQLVKEGRRQLSYFGIDQIIFGKIVGRPEDAVMTLD